MKKHLKHNTFRGTLLAFSFMLMLGCKTYLAPNYDQVIVSKSTQAATKTFQFFAAVSGGTNAESFFSREITYNELIGHYETLKLMARARPLPKSKTTERINKRLEEKNGPTNSDDYPSAFAFNRIIENLVKMKAADQKSGLNAFVVQAFKGEIEIFLDQAMTYESFLKR